MLLEFRKLIIFLSYIYSIKSNEIIIPFFSKLSEIPNNQTPQEFMSSLTSNEIYTKVNVGTPPQQFDFLLDFHNYNTYIVKNQKFFDNCSSTFTQLGSSQYFSDTDFINAINSSDIVTISDTLRNYNYTFLYADKFRLNAKPSYPGVIGFNVVPNQNPFHYESGLVYQLKGKNIIDNYIFTLSFNEDDFNGNIIIGKNIYENYPIENFTSDYCLVTSNYGYYWGWNYMTTYLNGETLGITEASIIPESGVIQLNINYKGFFKKKFFVEKINEGKCFDLYLKYSYYYCDKDVNIDIGELKFEIKRSGLHFSLNSKDLFKEYNNKLFFLIVFGIYVEKQEVKLGYPFLKKYDMIFDLDKRHVGFYNFKIKYDYRKENGDKKEINKSEDIEKGKDEKTDIDDKKNENTKDSKKNIKKENDEYSSFITEKIILIILIIFFSILLIYLLFTLFRICERKRKGKLFQELFL